MEIASYVIAGLVLLFGLGCGVYLYRFVTGQLDLDDSAAEGKILSSDEIVDNYMAIVESVTLDIDQKRDLRNELKVQMKRNQRARNRLSAKLEDLGVTRLSDFSAARHKKNSSSESCEKTL